jgi:hypothetical protein
MNITVSEELRAYIEPLTAHEHEALERSLSDFQRGVLALRRKDILTGSVPAVVDATAKAARLSSSILSHIKKIQQTAAPELVAAVKSGSISITAAANVASLPVAEQVAAAAGGKKELQQAARQVRESRAVERSEPDSPAGVIARLKQTITTLSAENAALKAQLAQLTAA